MRLSSTGDLLISFDRAIKPLPFEPSKKEASRSLTLPSISISDAIHVSISGSEVNSTEGMVDSLIKSVSFEEQTERSVKIKVYFADMKAITKWILEPDYLRVQIVLPSIFIDAETAAPLQREQLV